MGSRAELTIGDVTFGCWKDEIDPFILVLFSESEKRIREYPRPPEVEEILEDGEEWPFHVARYVTNVQTLKARLDFFGFTLDTTKRVFEIAMKQEIEDTRKSIVTTERFESSNVGDLSAHSPLLKRYQEKLEVLLRTDVDGWIEALTVAFQNPSQAFPDKIRTLADCFQPLLALKYDRFPASVDDRFRLRFELEVASSGEVVLDYSEFVNDEIYSPSDPITKYALDSLPADARQLCHIIVLTEGSTDKFYLETAMKVVHPEVVQYVSFLDFNGWNVAGGASLLESMVRSFAAAGIRDRIVAIFDNDAAGLASQARLSQLNLPANMRVLRYPDIEVARYYPTLGPSGTVTMDVNGSAASIEIYLGEDVLRNDDGQLIPIQWKAFEPSVKRYQGEIVDKRGCQKRFSEKLDRLNVSQGETGGSAWQDLLTITDAILYAFAKVDSDEIIEFVKLNA
jgi:hypothetical protein